MEKVLWTQIEVVLMLVVVALIYTWLFVFLETEAPTFFRSAEVRDYVVLQLRLRKCRSLMSDTADVSTFLMSDDSAWYDKTSHDLLSVQRVVSSQCSSRPDDECDLLANEASAVSTFDPPACADLRFSSRLKWKMQRKRERWYTHLSGSECNPKSWISVWREEERRGEMRRDEERGGERRRHDERLDGEWRRGKDRVGETRGRETRRDVERRREEEKQEEERREGKMRID